MRANSTRTHRVRAPRRHRPSRPAAGRFERVGEATRTRTRPSCNASAPRSGVRSGLQYGTNRPRRARSPDEGTPLAPPRRRPPATPRPGRSRRAARRAGRSARHRRSGRPGRSAAPSVPAIRYQMSSLSTRPHGSTSRCDCRARRARCRSSRTFRRRTTAACSSSTTAGCRGHARPSRPGRSTWRSAAASASARKVWGRARTSLRSADLASAGTAAAGPASRNSACASVAGQPAEVGAGAADQLPAAAATRLRIDRDPGGRQRLEVAAGSGHRHLQLGGQLGGGHSPAGLHQQQSGDKAVGSHDIEFAKQSAQFDEHFKRDDGHRQQRTRQGGTRDMLRGLTTVNFFADDHAAAASGTASCSASSLTSTARTTAKARVTGVPHR